LPDVDAGTADPASPPAVSVIIATYNWSAALRCAIQSARLQTLADIEIIVVGDACTDDSEAVAASFDDPRIRWINLPENCGHQYGPNNEGLRRARAPWVAYLGHDDIWWPDHLESGLRVAEESKADLVAGTTLLYGPPDSGIRGLTGLFRTGQWGPTEWAPPSSLLHRRSLVDGLGYWRDPATLALPSDVDFVKRLLAAGASTACTNQLTVFKFNAGRRDTYKTKTNAEQRAMLARIEAGIDVRHHELLDFVRADLDGKSFRPQMPPDAPSVQPGAIHHWNQTLKGTREIFTRDQVRMLRSRERFTIPDGTGWMEWHVEEQDSRHGPFRWTGPQQHSTILFPLRADGPFVVRLHVLDSVQAELLPPCITLNAQRLSVAVARTIYGTYMIEARAPAQQAREDAISLTIETTRTVRPCDLGINKDERRLGIAVNWIEFEPETATNFFQRSAQRFSRTFLLRR
jgi:glycosyltransferase involved in cell wall biosynthesis